MCYLRKIEYREYKIEAKESYPVLRKCSGCGKKSTYINTKNFRVNANGNRIDVWLIYQCEKCKHTFNLSIYERKRPEEIPKEEYEGFLSNKEELAEYYGKNKMLFLKNRAEIDWDRVAYRIIPTSTLQADDYVEVINESGLKLRGDRIAAELFGLSRSQVKKMIQNGSLEIEEKDGKKIFKFI